MNKKTKIIIAIIVILLVLVGVFLVLNNLSNKGQDQPKDVKEESKVVDEVNQETKPASENIEEPTNQEEAIVYRFDEKEEAQRETSREDLKQMAFAISERFGSYSNEGNFGNISDLKIYMTDSMKSWADSYIEEQSGNEYSGSYYGITSTALVGEVTEFNGDSASVRVTTKRKEIKDNNEDVFNQDIIINFNKVGDKYKINEAYWQ